MSQGVVKGPILTVNWLERRNRLFAELDKQLTSGICGTEGGITLDHLAAVVEHRNPWGRMGNYMFVRELDLPVVREFSVAENLDRQSGKAWKAGFGRFTKSFDEKFLKTTEKWARATKVRLYDLVSDEEAKWTAKALVGKGGISLSHVFHIYQKYWSLLKKERSQNHFFVTDPENLDRVVVVTLWFYDGGNEADYWCLDANDLDSCKLEAGERIFCNAGL